MWQLSIRSKIILVLLLTGLACLAAGAVIGYLAGESALTQSVEGRLIALRELKRLRVEAYVNNQLRFTAAVAASAETVEATKAFIAALREMRTETRADSPAMQADTVALETWYNNDLIPRLDKIAGSHTPVEGLMPADPVARRLQADYIARNPNPVGEKSKLLAAPGNSRYDGAHARYHPILKRIAATVGFYDVNLVDAASGDVVYTVDKETDFASNMYHGAFTESGLARVVQRALDPRNGGKAVVEDYTAYVPSALAPQMFAAVPIIADGQTIGVFVAQIDILTLNNLLTDNNGWRSIGEGETGEVLLTGEDRLLRSQSRFLIENPDTFLAQAKANGLPESNRRSNPCAWHDHPLHAQPVRGSGAGLPQQDWAGPLSGLSGRGGDLVFRPGGSGRPALGYRFQAGRGGGICAGDPIQAQPLGGRSLCRDLIDLRGVSLRRTVYAPPAAYHRRHARREQW